MKIYSECVGSGPPLLLLHGIGSNRRAFRHQLSSLSDTYTCIAWDAPGYGLSEDPDGPMSLAEMADWAATLLSEPAHVLGVSMGGVIAQLLYHQHPELVRSLILVDTSTSGRGAPDRVRQRLDAIERLGPRDMAEQRAPQLVTTSAPATLIAELADIMAEVHPSGYRNAAIALGDVDLSDRLTSIRVPVMVIHGERDTVVPLDTGRALARTIPGAQLVVIPDAGHVSNQEQPEAFNAAVRRFLELHDRAPSDLAAR